MNGWADVRWADGRMGDPVAQGKTRGKQGAGETSCCWWWWGCCWCCRLLVLLAAGGAAAAHQHQHTTQPRACASVPWLDAGWPLPLPQPRASRMNSNLVLVLGASVPRVLGPRFSCSCLGIGLDTRHQSPAASWHCRTWGVGHCGVGVGVVVCAYVCMHI
jgi:hypothetical protein